MSRRVAEAGHDVPTRVQWWSWWQWIVQPWRSTSVALALVGALALPALLLAAGPMFRRSASDAITTGTLDDVEPGPAGLVVTGVGALAAESLTPFATLTEEAFGRIPALAPPVRTQVSDTLVMHVEGEEPSTRRDVRLLARPGAADSVEVLDGDRDDDGVLVPANLADARGIGPGDMVTFGAGPPVRVAAVYRDVWDGGMNEYWEQAPGDVVPRFQRVFAAPSFELVIMEDETLLTIGPLGRVRWDAPLASPPTTWSGLQALTASYRAFEAQLVRPTELADAYRAFAADPDAPPSTFTALYEAEARAADLIEGLERPVRAATIGGVVAGLALSTLGAVFLVRRHRRVHRLMAADGDAAWRFFGRALLQYAIPASVGSAVGVVAAWVTISVLGPSGRADPGEIPWTAVALVTVVALVLAASVTAALAVRLTDALEVPVGSIGTTWLYLLVGTVVAMWLAVGDDDRRGADPLIVAFPLVGIVAGVLLSVVVLRVLLRAVRRTGGRLPTPIFLAWRALTASESGALGLTAAVGLATGLAVLSTSLVTSIDTATELKAATLVGSVSRLDTIDEIEPDVVPPESTIVQTYSTEIAGRPVWVLAVDPATYADAVEWPDRFGGSADELLELLATPAGDGDVVPIVAVGSADLPRRDELGVQRVFPYELVGTFQSVPMASDSRPTVVVRADVFEAVARERWNRGEQDVDQIEVLRAEALGQELEFVSPLEPFGNSIVSRQAPSVLSNLGEQLEWRAVEVTSADEVARSVGTQSVRWAFDFIGILAVIGGVVSLAALAFYLAERRASREVTTVMTEQMGISRRSNVIAAVAEMLGLVTVAVAAGAVSALVTTGRVVPSFEPSPAVPPSVGLVVAPEHVIALALGTFVAVGVIAAWTQRSVSSAQKARVLRG